MRIALKTIAFGLGNAFRIMLKRRTDLLFFSLFLEFFEFVEKEVALFGVHIQISKFIV